MSPLVVLSRGDSEAKDNIFHLNTSSRQDCRYYLWSDNAYLGCDGKWRQLSLSDIAQTFDFPRGPVVQSYNLTKIKVIIVRSCHVILFCHSLFI